MKKSLYIAFICVESILANTAISQDSMALAFQLSIAQDIEAELARRFKTHISTLAADSREGRQTGLIFIIEVSSPDGIHPHPPTSR